jgi:Sec-independent protein translocase protein TatA
MFGFGGLSEVLFIMFLAMLIFGPEKLPEIGRMLAKGMAEVRKASNELKRTLNAELAATEQEQEARRNAQLAAVPPPPPSWSGGQTVPNLPAPAEAVVPPAGAESEGQVGAAQGGVAPADAAPAGAAWTDAAAGEAAEISEAAYLADWPEDLPPPPPPAALVDQGTAEPAGSAGSAGSTGSAGSNSPDRSASTTPAADSASPRPAELAPSLLAHGERGGRDSA